MLWRKKPVASQPTLQPALTALTGTTTAEDCFQRGIAYFEQGDYELAIAEYNQALALNPQYAERIALGEKPILVFMISIAPLLIVGEPLH